MKISSFNYKNSFSNQAYLYLSKNHHVNNLFAVFNACPVKTDQLVFLIR